MPTYTHKIVNGVLTTCNSADQTVLAARDAADWVGNPGAPVVVGTAAERLARMAKTFRLTVAELKSEIARP